MSAWLADKMFLSHTSCSFRAVLLRLKMNILVIHYKTCPSQSNFVTFYSVIPSAEFATTKTWDVKRHFNAARQQGSFDYSYSRWKYRSPYLQALIQMTRHKACLLNWRHHCKVRLSVTHNFKMQHFQMWTTRQVIVKRQKYIIALP